LLHIYQELGPFKVSGGHSAVVLLAWEVEVRQPPIRNSNMAFLVIDENISWFDVSMDYSLRVSELEANEQLENIGLDVVDRELGPELSEICVVDEFKNY